MTASLMLGLMGATGFAAFLLGFGTLPRDGDATVIRHLVGVTGVLLVVLVTAIAAAGG